MSVSIKVYGEDPTTIAKLGAAYITGIQHGDVGAPETPILLVASSPKHFTDYNLECSCYRASKAGVERSCDPENPAAGCKAPTGIGRFCHSTMPRWGGCWWTLAGVF